MKPTTLTGSTATKRGSSGELKASKQLAASQFVCDPERTSGLYRPVFRALSDKYVFLDADLNYKKRETDY